MEHENYIVAIDLGTSHLVGLAGMKTAEGTLTILAEEVEPSASCIRRGCVYNVEDTALRINRLIMKLENKLNGHLPSGFSIEKVYIGIGGQSLRSYKHVEVKIINTDALVTKEDISQLDAQCQAFKPDMLDVLAIFPPAYYANGVSANSPSGVPTDSLSGVPTDSPSGIPCKSIEARYRLIVGKPAIRNNIKNSIERSRVKLAGIIVSPLALADAIFSRDEKELGCALIDLGAGVTSVVVFKKKNLIHLSVIPFGGNVITRDLASLRFVESEAEQLKITYGSAVPEKDKTSIDAFEARNGIGLHEINTVVGARAREIVENIYAQIKSTGEMDTLEKIVLAGGASALKNLQALVRERFKKEVGFSTIRKEWMTDGNDDRIGNPCYMTAISLLIKGVENCIVIPSTQTNPGKDEIKKEKMMPLKPIKDEDTKGGSFFTGLFNKLEQLNKKILEQD